MKDFVGNPVDDISVRLVALVIVDRGHDVVRIPQPVLIPRQLIPKHRAMGVPGITGVSLLYLRAIWFDPPDCPRHLPGLGELIILDLIGDCIGYQLPALPPVIGD